jgi:ankyrin repeat protein
LYHRGADIDYCSVGKKRGGRADISDSLLYPAIKERNTDTLKTLLDAGADVNAVEDIKWDLRANVFPEAETDNPSPAALEYKRYLDSGEEILKMLKEYGAKVPYDRRTKIKPTFVGTGYGWREEYNRPNGILDINTLWGAASPDALKLRIAAGADVNERDKENWTALHYITDGNYFGRDAMIEVLLAAGAKVDARGGPDSNITPLMLAARQIREHTESLETIKLLLKNGANLKAKTKSNQTVLRWAADWWNSNAAGEKSMLLEIIGELERTFSRAKKTGSARREIDVDLMTAAFWARPEKLAEILSHGADVNVRSKNGYTPLMFASMYNHDAAVNFLIESGADPNARNKNVETPLLLAAGTRDAEVVKALLEGGADLYAKDAYGNSPLARLSWGIMEESSYETVHRLCEAMTAEKSESVENSAGDDGENEKEDILDSGNEKEIETISKEEQNFLQHGLTVEKDMEYEPFRADYNSLFKLNDEKSLVKAVKNGLNIALNTDDGWYFFEAAIENNAMKVLRACIEMGADVNHTDGHGGQDHWSSGPSETPLYAAAKRGNLEAVKILVENGLDAKSAEMLPCVYRKNDFPEGRVKGDKSACEFKQILDRNAKILNLLRNVGFDIPGKGLEMTFTDIDGEKTPGDEHVLALVRAVSPLALKKLIDSGADVNARDENGQTALHYLASFDYWSFKVKKYYDLQEMIKLMLVSGADVNAADASGWTPLMGILRCHEGEILLELLTAVIASGADFEKTSGGGESALDTLRDEYRLSDSKHKHESRIVAEFCGEIKRAFGRKSNADERVRANGCSHL